MARKQASEISSLTINDADSISSGYGLIDYVADSTGLFPRGAIVELAGLKSTSKTSLVLDTIAYNMHINPNFRVLYADFESMIYNQADYLRKLGVDIHSPNFVLISPSTMEEGCNAIRKELKLSQYDMIVVDTVAAMRPAAEAENKTGETKQIGLRGKLMSEFLRNLNADMAATDYKPAVVLINQLYQQLDITFGKAYDSPASAALSFYAAIRYQLKERKKIKDKIKNPYTFEEEEVPIGMIVEISTVKNKLGRPNLKTMYFYTYNFGIDMIPRFTDAAYNSGVITNKGASKSSFLLPSPTGEKTVIGMSKLWRTLGSDLYLSKHIAKLIDEKVAEDLGHKVNFWQKEIDLYELRLQIRNKFNDSSDDDALAADTFEVKSPEVEVLHEDDTDQGVGIERGESILDEDFQQTKITGKINLGF